MSYGLPTYFGTTFVPYLKSNRPVIPNHLFNTFGGFYLETIPYKKPKVPIDQTAIYHLITRILSNQNPQMGHYLLSFLAWKLIYPMRRSLVCFSWVSSDQGCGKSSFAELLKRLVGARYFASISQGMENKFNSIYEDKLFVILEEAEGKEYIKFQNILKDLISCTNLTIERKGFERYTVPVCFELIVYSNSSRCIRVEQTDRRFCVIKPSNEKVGDYKFWDKFYAEIEDDQTMRAFFEYLIKRDVSNFNPRCFPKTKIREELQIVSETLPTRFIRWLFTELNIYALHQSDMGEVHSKCPLFEDIYAVPIIFCKKGLFITNTYLIERFKYFCFETLCKKSIEGHFIKSHFRSTFGIAAQARKTIFGNRCKGYFIPLGQLKDTLTKLFGPDYLEEEGFLFNQK